MNGNGGNKTFEQPLDRVTERAISELTARLLPELTRALTPYEPRERSQALAQTMGKIYEALTHVEDALRQEVKGAAAGRQEILGAISLLSKSSPAPQPTDPTSEKLESALPNWEGILRAHAQAQSQELDSLSRELGNLQRQGEATLAQKIREALSQEAAQRDEEWARRVEEAEAAMARRLRGLRLALWALAGLGTASLLTSLAALLR